MSLAPMSPSVMSFAPRSDESAAILETLALAGERCPDPTSLVYRSLFDHHPDLESLFARDCDGSVRGEMLAKVFETIVDLVGDRTYGANMMRCEAVTHSGYGVAPTVFVEFYAVLWEIIRALAGPDWTPRHQAAWALLVCEATALVA